MTADGLDRKRHVDGRGRRVETLPEIQASSKVPRCPRCQSERYEESVGCADCRYPLPRHYWGGV